VTSGPVRHNCLFSAVNLVVCLVTSLRDPLPFCWHARQIEAFFEYYPRRVGQVLFVEAPWVFTPLWHAIKPMMRKYGALVSVFMRVEHARGFVHAAFMDERLVKGGMLLGALGLASTLSNAWEQQLCCS
jgi:hypothetical protein